MQSFGHKFAPPLANGMCVPQSEAERFLSVIQGLIERYAAHVRHAADQPHCAISWLAQPAFTGRPEQYGERLCVEPASEWMDFVASLLTLWCPLCAYAESRLRLD
jgi:hypothetical protein